MKSIGRTKGEQHILVKTKYKKFIIVACLFPFLLIGWDAYNHQLGIKPIETVLQRTGDWTLRFLLLTLAVTPVRRYFGWSSAIRYRRMLGLFVFFYACLHLSTYLILDQVFHLSEIVKDIVKRPYITLGFVAFLLSITLAATSTSKMKKRLGKRWKSLHQLIYLFGLLGVMHYLWLVKKELMQPLLYAAIFLVLMAVRVWDYRLPIKSSVEQ